MKSILDEYKRILETECGVGVNFENVNYNRLKEAIQQKRESGSKGTDIDILFDLEDFDGLGFYGVEYN